MKNLRKPAAKAGAIMALGLLILSSSLTFANNSDKEGSDNTMLQTEAFRQANNEVIEDIVMIEDYATVIMIFDENDDLIYDATLADLEFDPVLEILLRRSNFLVELDGVRFYLLDR